MARNARRIFLISKNFWPVSGQTELLAASFAEKLSLVVDQVDVITWRMIRQWPDRFQFGKCQVIRLPQSHRTSWSPAALGYYGRNRWHRSLQRWIASERKRYDAGIVFEFEDDGLAPSVIVGRSEIPVVSRIHQTVVGGLARNTIRDLRSLKSRSIAFVTPDQEMLMNSLAGLDGPFASLKWVGDGQPDDLKTTSDRKTSREILSRVHPIFSLDSDALLLICGADLTFESGVFSLVRAWRRVLAAYPKSRLWLIGTGRNAPELFQRICDLDMQHSVLLTGNFDDVSDILSAADAFVMPGVDRPGWYAHSASQLGLTIIQHRNSSAIETLSGTNTLIFDDETRSLDLVLSRWASSLHSRLQSFDSSRPLDPGRNQQATTFNPSNDDSVSDESISNNSISKLAVTEMVQQYLSIIQDQIQPVDV